MTLVYEEFKSLGGISSNNGSVCNYSAFYQILHLLMCLFTLPEMLCICFVKGKCPLLEQALSQSMPFRISNDSGFSSPVVESGNHEPELVFRSKEENSELLAVNMRLPKVFFYFNSFKRVFRSNVKISALLAVYVPSS